jgi:mono/diheme cytochrome c family protein
MKPNHLIFAASFVLSTTVLSANASDPVDAWNQNCVRCHGPDGKGQTKMGRKLKIKDLTSERSRARLTEDRIVETITEGKQDSNGDERMPSFREKLSESDRNALATYVRALNKKIGLTNSE